MSRKKAPGPPPHLHCALCGNKGVVESKEKVVVDRGRGPESFIQMVRCPGPKTARELDLEAMAKKAEEPPRMSGQDRAAGE